MRHAFHKSALTLLLATSASASNAQFGRAIEIPPGAKVSLEFDRATFFLGENIAAHFRVQNVGKVPFSVESGGDYRGARRHLRFKVTAVGPDGKAVADPFPSTNNMGGIGGSSTVNAGESWYQTLSLPDYIAFEKPGKYLVSAQHDLGWEATAQRPLPIATASIQVLAPTVEQARTIVEAAARPPLDPGRRMGEKWAVVAPNFAAMRDPIYLPLLAERVRGGDSRFLDSLAQMETPGATQSLIWLLEGEPKIAQDAAKVLASRLPLSPQGLALWSHPGAEAMKAQRLALTARSWRAEFVPAVQRWAHQAVASTERDTLRTAALMLESVGDASDSEAVLSALEARIAQTQKSPRWQSQNGERGNDGDGWQLQDDCLLLMRAADALLQRGAVLPAEQTAAVIAVQIQSSQGNPERRTEQWSVRQASWLQHPVPFIRQLTLQSLGSSSYPPPKTRLILAPPVRALLPMLLAEPDTSVRAAACEIAGATGDKALLPEVLQVLASARNGWLIDAANAAAVALGGQYEAWLVWAQRLDEPNMMRPAIQSLHTAIKRKGGGYGWAARTDEKQSPALKTKWLAFLRANEKQLRAGHRFELGDVALPAGLFPQEFSLH